MLGYIYIYMYNYVYILYFQVSAGLYAQLDLYPKTAKLATQALVLLEPQCCSYSIVYMGVLLDMQIHPPQVSRRAKLEQLWHTN